MQVKLGLYGENKLPVLQTNSVLPSEAEFRIPKVSFFLCGDTHKNKTKIKI